jgi:hypothetical protein
VNFTDPQLENCYDRNFEAVRDNSPEVRQVRALIAAHDFFRRIEGPHSRRVHEAIDHLLSLSLRPALRFWYQQPGANTDFAAINLRDQLSQLTGENLQNNKGNSAGERKN